MCAGVSAVKTNLLNDKCYSDLVKLVLLIQCRQRACECEIFSRFFQNIFLVVCLVREQVVVTSFTPAGICLVCGGNCIAENLFSCTS